MNSRVSVAVTILILTCALAGLFVSGCGGGGGGGSESGGSNGLGGVSASGGLTLRVNTSDGPPRVQVRGEVIHLAVSSSARMLEVELFRLPSGQSDVPVLSRSIELAEGVTTARIDEIPAPANYRVVGRLLDLLGTQLSSFQVEVQILPGQITFATVTSSPTLSPTVTPTLPAPGPRIDISSTATPVSFHDLDVRSDGSFAVIFGQNSSTQVRARAYTLPAGLTPSPVPLYTPSPLPIGGVSPTPFAIEPRVAVNDAGVMAVYWIKELNGIRSVAAQFFNFSNATALTSAVTMGVGSATNVLDTLSGDLPLTGAGKGEATWVQTQGFDAMLNTVATVGVADTPGRVSTTPLNEKSPNSAQDEGGNIAVVVEQQSTSDELSLYLFSNDRQQVSSVPAFFTGSLVDVPQVALRNGLIAVAFTVETPDPQVTGQFLTQLKLARFTYDPLNPAQVPVLQDLQLVHETTVSDFFGPPLKPDVAVSLAGKTIVVWQDPDVSFLMTIRARGYSETGTPGTTFAVSEAQGDPRVGFDSSGRYVVTWLEDQGVSNVQVFGRAYPANFNIP